MSDIIIHSTEYFIVYLLIFSTLSKFLLHTDKDISVAAKLLLQGHIER